MPLATYLWPGLPRLLREGAWSSLGFAVGFACLLNLALLGTLWWSELFSPAVRNLLCAAALVIWGVAFVYSLWHDGRTPAPRDPGPTARWFIEAQNHYLRGNWFESEQLVRALLARDPRDVHAGLMLASILRRTGRLEEAQRQLDGLARFEASARWEFEIARERDRVAELADEGDAPSDATHDASAEIADAA